MKRQCVVCGLGSEDMFCGRECRDNAPEYIKKNMRINNNWVKRDYMDDKRKLAKKNLGRSDRIAYRDTEEMYIPKGIRACRG